ncbi:hypothetical protein M422DRAFT_255311 [Sphaerobolus stellatus SS14]|uniref:Uncharacterized protein n=1 Tax=Sphaerobolus stellatus (strain SS14) TaxID=990650 RepID=A0A0C9VU28_SPHS4|nr:hypothetical protein M422DRAFT_255311 [Sphaerobolus stellatus SS14]
MKFGGHGDIGHASLTSYEFLGVMGVSVLPKPYMAWRLRVTRRLTRSMLVWQRRQDSDSGFGNGSGSSERRWCGLAAMHMDAKSRPRPQCPSLHAHAGVPTRWSTTRAPSSNPSPPASIRASPQQLRPIRLRLLRSRTINVTLLTGRRDLPAASLVHRQDVSRRTILGFTQVAMNKFVLSKDTIADKYFDHVAGYPPFPSPTSSFVPLPMPATHEYAGRG